MIRRQQKQRGFSLLEVLVALVVLSVGLLGLAAMQAEGLRGSSNAQMRHQAARLVGDIVDRMRANQAGVATDDYAIATGASASGGQEHLCADNDGQGVTANSCSPTQMALYDVYLWREDVADLLPSGSSSIVRVAANRFVITVGWTDRGGNLSVSTEVQFYAFR